MEPVRQRISRALEPRHVSISADVVLEVLDEAVGTFETLTAGEQEFLITYAGATRGDFTVEAENLT